MKFIKDMVAFKVFSFLLKQYSKILLNIIAIIYVIFDEVFVYLTNKLNDLIIKYNLFENLNQKLRSLHRYNILILLILVLGVSELIGILSFVFLAKGSLVIFITLYIIKFFPFFVVSYIFKHTKDILLEIDFFKYCYEKICLFTDYLKTMEIIIKIKEIKNNFKEKLSIKKNVLKEKLKYLIKKHQKD